MTTEELEDKFIPLVYPYIGSSFLTGTESPEVIKMNVKECAKISIEFAIELLEELNTKMSFPNQIILDKISELKSKLNE